MTESHLRRLNVIMRALEEGLREIESTLVSEPSDPILSVDENDVAPERYGAIRDSIARIRGEIIAVKERYGLHPEVISARRRFTAKLTLLSIDLTEGTSRHLRAYGEVPEAERDPLDEQIIRMRSMVDELNRIIAS